MTVPDRPIVALAIIAIVEAAALLAYALFDVVEAVRVGITGPAEVSNPAALALLIAITAALGAGMVWVAWGWWRCRRWARAPFVLAQLLIVLIGYELTQSAGATERVVGMAGVGLAILGLILAFAPGMTGRLDDEDQPWSDS